jgi:hypothetical protein
MLGETPHSIHAFVKEEAMKTFITLSMILGLLTAAGISPAEAVSKCEGDCSGGKAPSKEIKPGELVILESQKVGILRALPGSKGDCAITLKDKDKILLCGSGGVKK